MWTNTKALRTALIHFVLFQWVIFLNVVTLKSFGNLYLSLSWLRLGLIHFANALFVRRTKESSIWYGLIWHEWVGTGSSSNWYKNKVVFFYQSLRVVRRMMNFFNYPTEQAIIIFDTYLHISSRPFLYFIPTIVICRYMRKLTKIVKLLTTSFIYYPRTSICYFDTYYFIF